jgi:hypothetical protein
MSLEMDSCFKVRQQKSLFIIFSAPIKCPLGDGSDVHKNDLFRCQTNFTIDVAPCFVLLANQQWFISSYCDQTNFTIDVAPCFVLLANQHWFVSSYCDQTNFTIDVAPCFVLTIQQGFISSYCDQTNLIKYVAPCFFCCWRNRKCVHVLCAVIKHAGICQNTREVLRSTMQSGHSNQQWFISSKQTSQQMLHLALFY